MFAWPESTFFSCEAQREGFGGARAGSGSVTSHDAAVFAGRRDWIASFTASHPVPLSLLCSLGREVSHGAVVVGLGKSDGSIHTTSALRSRNGLDGTHEDEVIQSRWAARAPYAVEKAAAESHVNPITLTLTLTLLIYTTSALRSLERLPRSRTLTLTLTLP